MKNRPLSLRLSAIIQIHFLQRFSGSVHCLRKVTTTHHRPPICTKVQNEIIES
jgi:hypothetical protein